MKRQETAWTKVCLVGVVAAFIGCGSGDGAGTGKRSQEVRFAAARISGRSRRRTGSSATRPRSRRARPPSGPPTPTPQAELDDDLKKIKLPPGFKIALWADGIPEARQMAWGDKGTLFVGTFDRGIVYAVTDGPASAEGRKTFIKGLRMPTGVAFRDGALYVVDIDKLYRYDGAEAKLDKTPEGKVVYDDIRPTSRTAGSTSSPTRRAGSTSPSACPATSASRRPAPAQIRRVNPKTGAAEIVALGVRNSVGGDVDPRTGQFWFTENGARLARATTCRATSSTASRGSASISAIPYCHQGDIAGPEVRRWAQVLGVHAAGVKLGPHVAPLGMKFYTGDMFPPEYKNNIFIAEHGSWNRAKYQGARIMRVIVDPDGKNAKEEVFAEGWLEGTRRYLGRPADILHGAKDGSLLVADDQAGAIYRISYQK